MRRLGLVLALTLAGCASAGGPRHISTVSVVSAHSTLALLQDSELLLVCGKAGAPAPPACVPQELHQQVSAKLADAFEADKRLAVAVRDWLPNQPKPTNIQELLTAIANVVQWVLDHLPASAPKDKLVAQLQGAL